MLYVEREIDNKALRKTHYHTFEITDYLTYQAKAIRVPIVTSSTPLLPIALASPKSLIFTYDKNTSSKRESCLSSVIVRVREFFKKTH